MKTTKITESKIQKFRNKMREEEKSKATVTKYVREIELLKDFLKGRELTKELLLEYRDMLLKYHQVQTVNGKISAVNAYLNAAQCGEYRLKFLKVQRNAFAEEKRELTEKEYKRLLKAAENKKNDRLYHLLLTLAGTGIRVSELQFITVEAIQSGQAHIQMKGKKRTILLTGELRKRLKRYARDKGIHEGHIFRTRSGRPLDRSNICHEMKKLCKAAGVGKEKVFPHNLRHLFARTFYKVEKNLAHLADILGHSSIETTRLYIVASAKEYEQTLRRMGLLWQ